MSSSKTAMQTVAGLATARGLVSGPVCLYRGGGDLAIPEFTIADDQVGVELARLKRSHELMKRDLENLVNIVRERTNGADVAIFESHLMILEDPMLVEETAKHIREGHVNAECAVRRTANGVRAKFAQMNDPYFRERVLDVNDVERRHLNALMGADRNPHLELKAPSIVVADDLTPSETVQLPRELVLGFATNGGSTTSHVALLARALGIPAVTGLVDITERVKPGQVILLDGNTGTVTLNPSEGAKSDFNALVERQRTVLSVADGSVPGQLADGSRVLIFANLHPGAPTDGVKGFGAQGVGLYRSEYLWLNRDGVPTEEEQFDDYRKAVEFASTLGPDATLTIRTLDIGGDKMVRGVTEREANPFLGNRSLRYLLSHRDVFREQLRAILRASAFGRICLLYPMVSCVEELSEAAVELEGVKRQLDADGVAFDRDLPVGAMIEVPSAALNADALAPYVKFFSIGTNDLVQYTMAADRTNEAVAHLYQPFHPAVLKLMRMTVDSARRNGIHVGVCGESASVPAIAVLWVAFGAEMLSMSATYIPIVARLLSRLTRADLDAYAAFVESAGASMPAADSYSRACGWLRAKIPDLDDLIA